MYQPGHLPFFNPTEESGFRPPPALLMAALRRVRGLDLELVNGHAPEIVNGNILTGDVFVNSATHRMLLAGWGGKAVEMEGAALAQVAHEFGVPCLVVRALSDLRGRSRAAPSPELFAQFVGSHAEWANSARVGHRSSSSRRVREAANEMSVLTAGRSVDDVHDHSATRDSTPGPEASPSIAIGGAARSPRFGTSLPVLAEYRRVKAASRVAAVAEAGGLPRHLRS